MILRRPILAPTRRTAATETIGLAIGLGGQASICNPTSLGLFRCANSTCNSTLRRTIEFLRVDAPRVSLKSTQTELAPSSPPWILNTEMATPAATRWRWRAAAYRRQSSLTLEWSRLLVDRQCRSQVASPSSSLSSISRRADGWKKCWMIEWSPSPCPRESSLQSYSSNVLLHTLAPCTLLHVMSTLSRHVHRAMATPERHRLHASNTIWLWPQ